MIPAMIYLFVKDGARGKIYGPADVKSLSIPIIHISD